MNTKPGTLRGAWVLVGIVAALVLGMALGAFFVNSEAACGTGDSNVIDLLRARNFGASAFDDKWSNSYSVEPYTIRVVRESGDFGALTLMEYLIFNCGYAAADLDAYFSDDNFYTIILADYENPLKTNQCQSQDGTRLYEFTAQFQGQNYLLRQWAKPDGEKRVIGFFMVFPLENQSAMLEYAGKLFPELSTCP